MDVVDIMIKIAPFLFVLIFAGVQIMSLDYVYRSCQKQLDEKDQDKNESELENDDTIG